jgi:hypothetical protein
MIPEIMTRRERQGRQKKGFDNQPAASCGSQWEPPRRGPARPMLFAQKFLAPGPQTKHPGIVNPLQADPRQSRGFTIVKLIS